ncbi:hypothetical protein P7K49_029834 [Saguinus oedipus]|uniref:Uncharacterized protein n=1 Tax=Saguinus oedipus TaxID=9490 RepID=A0ABQ9U8C2_SAGOE|nr:hypothetical protein P7K49_029834 [Saguinus oedipus]
MHPRKRSRCTSNMYKVYAMDKNKGFNWVVHYNSLKTAGSQDWEFFTIDPIRASSRLRSAWMARPIYSAIYSVRAGPSARGGDWGWLSSGLGSRTSPPGKSPGDLATGKSRAILCSQSSPLRSSTPNSSGGQ